MRASKWARVLAVALTFSRAAAADEAPPKAGDGKLLAGGGFTLPQPKWKKSGAGENTGLTVRYDWGGKGERKATVAEAGGDWFITFADSPAADEVAKLTLEFEFSLLSTEKPALRTAAKKGIDEAIKLVGNAVADAHKAYPADSTSFAKDAATRVKAGASTVVDALKPLRDLRTKDGKAGDQLVLEALGFQKTSEGGWELPSLALDRLRTIDEKRHSAGVDSYRSLADAQKATLSALPTNKEDAPSRSACVDATKAALEDKGDDIDGLKKCEKLVSDYWKPELAKRVAAQADVAKQQPLKDFDQSIDAMSGLIANVAAPDFQVGAGAVETNGQKTAQTLISKGEAVEKASFSLNAFKYFRARIFLTNAQAAVDSDVQKILDDLTKRIDTMTQQQLGQALLEQGAEKRRFQAATGFVYMTGLDQVVMPLMVSYCFVDGCIGKGKSIFDGEPIKHMFSFDVGVRGATIERADPRDSKDVAFLAGLSFDPIWFIRVSGGRYVFFNGQSHEWNSTWYGGVTFDLIHAAALFGVTGLGVPQPPHVASTAQVPSNGAK